MLALQTYTTDDCSANYITLIDSRERQQYYTVISDVDMNVIVDANLEQRECSKLTMHVMNEYISEIRRAG